MKKLRKPTASNARSGCPQWNRPAIFGITSFEPGLPASRLEQVALPGARSAPESGERCSLRDVDEEIISHVAQPVPTPVGRDREKQSVKRKNALRIVPQSVLVHRQRIGADGWLNPMSPAVALPLCNFGLIQRLVLVEFVVQGF